MKIKILTSCSGLHYSFCAGENAEVTSEVGNDLVDGGLAEKVDAEPKPKSKAGAKANAET